MGTHGEAQTLDIVLNAQIEYYTGNQPDWEQIFYEWVAWGLPLDDFYNYPASLILKVWQGVKKTKATEANAHSMAAANIAWMVYEYIRDHDKSVQKTLWDFLPYDLKSAKQSEKIDQETAIIIIKARNSGNLPPNILREIIGVPDLYESILQQANIEHLETSTDK